MQQAAGIIAEYNPFHNGHLYHLQQTKEKTNLPVIIIMSGSIMQRGEPAFLDKWTRARLAVANGADLVIELPAAFSLRSAQYFAAGAVALLQACGCVSTLSCGTENPATDFAALASALTSSECSKLLQERLKRGLSYAAASEQVLQQLTGQDIRLDTPNDILALEYSKALLRTDIKPIFIRRRHADYNDTVISEAQRYGFYRALTGKVGVNTAASYKKAPMEMYRVTVADDGSGVQGLADRIEKAYLWGFLQTKGIDLNIIRNIFVW